MMTHPVAVHQIHDEGPAGGERAADRFEHGEIVLRALEIAERISEDADAVKVTVAKTKPPRIAFVKRDLQVALLGALAVPAKALLIERKGDEPQPKLCPACGIGHLILVRLPLAVSPHSRPLRSDSS